MKVYIVLLIACVSPEPFLGFIIKPTTNVARHPNLHDRVLPGGSTPHQGVRVMPSTTTTRLYESAVEVKCPNQKEAVALGAREWPQQVKSGTWSERIDAGATAARYVLMGTGSLDVTLLDEENNNLPKTDVPTTHKLVPGSLVEAMGPAVLEWTVDEDNNEEMVLLTPGYENSSLFAAVGAFFVVLCGVLLSKQFQ